MSEKRFKKMDTIIDPFPIWDSVEEKGYNCTDTLDLLVDLLNEQQATITSLEDENLYKNFELKSVDDLKKLKDIFEICMILIDGAIANEDLELGYESAFQFERRIKKFNGD